MGGGGEASLAHPGFGNEYKCRRYLSIDLKDWGGGSLGLMSRGAYGKVQCIMDNDGTPPFWTRR